MNSQGRDMTFKIAVRFDLEERPRPTDVIIIAALRLRHSSPATSYTSVRPRTSSVGRRGIKICENEKETQLETQFPLY
jgi:hypothetical protein